MRRLIVGLSGASGQIYGIRLLQALRAMPDVESHLIITRAARQAIAAETDWTPRSVEALAGTVYRVSDIGAAIASGSFETAGMIVAPCSVKHLAAVAHSYADDLLSRAADVQLKEGRPVLLMVRETPLHLGHIELLLRAARIGCVIFPPAPSFYGRPASVDDIVNDTVGRMLSRIGLPNDLYARWPGSGSPPPASESRQPPDSPLPPRERGQGRGSTTP